MCFSASASFGAGTTLCVIGLIALKKVKTPGQIAFGSIPLLFSIQQFAEGFVWLSLTNKNYETYRDYSTHSFLFFAHVVWPILIPFSMLLIEKSVTRKRILLVLTWLGILLGSYLACCLILYPVKVEINSFHIDYSLNFPISLTRIGGIVYFLVTVFPAFISSVKRMPLLGVLITVSYFFTKLFYSGYLISVWCFFAAIISVIVLYIVAKMQVPLVVVK